MDLDERGDEDVIRRVEEVVENSGPGGSAGIEGFPTADGVPPTAVWENPGDLGDEVELYIEPDEE